MISKEERADKEKEAYNQGLNRKKYSQGFGHAQAGYANERKKKAIANILKRGKGKDILELGSTSWKQFIDFEAYPPKSLTCINISEKELEKGIKASKKIKKKQDCPPPIFQIMDAHNLNFPDNTFDFVFGTGILHHLDFEIAVKEISRVLKEDGEMVFLEPLGRNPIGKLVRRLTPEARTADEKPLDKWHFQLLEQYFNMDNSFYQLFYVPAGVLSKHIFSSPYNPLTRAADCLDMWLEKISRKRGVCLYYRMVVIHGTKKIPLTTA